MDKHEKIKIASILGIIGNIFLLIIKGIIGFITKSNSMLADAFNSAGDIFSSLMTYIGNKIASKPRDNDHNLGHGKAEYIYSMIISMIMILTSLLIAKDLIVSLINKHTYKFSIWLIVVCTITIVIKISLYIYTNRLSKKYHNILIKANSKDHLIDAIVTSINLVSCILGKYNIYYLDAPVSLLIVTWIIYSSFKIFKESYDILMDKCIDTNTKKEV